jgi:hypothetical protein
LQVVSGAAFGQRGAATTGLATPLNASVRRTRDTSVQHVLKYLELKSGYSDDGPAWIAKVGVSKSGRTLYFNGKALKRRNGVAGNHFDLETGEEWWISSVKKNGSDRHSAGSGKVSIEFGVIEEYLAAMGVSELDRSRFEIIPDLKPTDPSVFYDLENERL